MVFLIWRVLNSWTLVVFGGVIRWKPGYFSALFDPHHVVADPHLILFTVYRLQGWDRGPKWSEYGQSLGTVHFGKSN